MKRFLFFLMACLCMSTAVMAQEPVCKYLLVKTDSYGDGWNGGVLKITDGEFVQEYTLESGSYGEDSIPYYGNDVVFEWISGSWSYEVGFTVLAPNGKGLLHHASDTPFDNFPDTLKTSPCLTGPNPDAPQNVVATLLSDRTLQVVWDPVTGASTYGVSIINQSGVQLASVSGVVDTFYVTGDPILKSGDYTFKVASYASDGMPLGITSETFHIDLPIISEATISMLIPADCGMDVSEGAWICWWVDRNIKQYTEKMTAKGGHRFEAVIHPNAPTYGFYVMNKQSVLEDGAHYTYFQTDQMAETFCGEVALSSENDHYIHTDDCSSPDHDFRLFNMTATPLSADSVVFHWECDTFPAGHYYNILLLDADGNSLGWLSDIVADTVSITDTLRLNVTAATTFGWYVVFADHLGYSHYAFGPNFTTKGGGSFVPRNLKVQDNGDQTYTFTWDAPADPAAWVAEVGSYSTPLAGNIRSYTSPALSAGNYWFELYALDEDDQNVGYAYINFCANELTSPADYYLDIYIPDNAQMDTLAGGYALRWDYYGFETDSVVPLQPIGANWYEAALLGLTKSRISFTVLNAPTEADATILESYEGYVDVAGSGVPFILNRDFYGNRFINVIEDDYQGYDYTPYNLQGTSADGALTITWESNEKAPYYYIYLYDENGREINGSADSFDESRCEMSIPTDTVMSVYFQVIPSYNYWGSSDENAAAWSELITVQPSNMNPKDLQATLNADGTYTISWSAPANRKIEYYEVHVRDLYGNTVCYEYVYEALSCNIGAVPTAGTYIYYVYAVSTSSYGGAYSTFTVESVDPHDVTVRVLIHPDSEFDTSSTVKFQFYDYVEDEWVSVTATSEGEYWYSATYTALTPAARFRVNSSTDYYYCNADACFELLTSSWLRPASCDAKAHDYRIIAGSLDVTNVTGRVDMMWDAQDMAERYYVQVYNSDNYGIHSSYVYDSKLYAYQVPSDRDGQTITWSVRPISSEGHWYPEVKYTTPITLAASEITISDLKLSTKDSLTLDMSWSCDSASLDFLVRVYCNDYDRICKVDTVVNDTSYHYAIPVNAWYRFAVCPLDPDNHGIIGEWKSSTWINLYKAPVPALVTNLQGSADQLRLTFSWETDQPQVYAEIYRYNEASNDYNWLADSVMTAKEWVRDVEIEGLYMIEIQPMVEVSPGQWTTLNYYYYATTTAWTVKTYNVEISATEGGEIWPGDLSGTYPDGFELSVEAYTNQEGYRFVGWSDGETDYDRIIIVHSDLKLTAIFEKLEKHHLSLAATEGGKIYIYDTYGTDDYFTTFEHDYYPEAGYYVAYVSAEPEVGYSFYQWSDGSTDDDFDYYAEEDLTLTAIFKPNCKLTVPNVVNGSVGVTGYDTYEDQTVQMVYSVAYGRPVTMTAYPAPGYRFTGWSDGVMTLQREVILVGDSVISASFADASLTPQYTITLGTSGTDGKGNGYLNLSNGNHTFYEGDMLSLVATPYSNSHFVKWSDENTDNPRTVTVSRDSTFTAIFAINTYTLNVTATEGGKVEIDPVKAAYEYGEYVSVTAIADEHNKFVGWSDDPYGWYGYDESRSIYMDKDKEIQAIFEKDKYMIIFLNEDSTYLDSKLWGYGETPTCETPTKSSTAQYTYSFKGWDPAVEPVTKEQTYVATYNKAVRKYKVTFLDWDDTELKVQQVPYNTAAEAPENPTRAGYRFIGWDKDFSHVTMNLTVHAEYEMIQGLENVDGDDVQCSKVLRDGHIYIIRGDKTYTITGSEVK